MKLTILSADDKLAEIRRLYFATTKPTIERDLAKALDLLKSMDTEEERERATVYMDGLAQMRKDWARAAKPGVRPAKAPAGKSAAKKTATKATGASKGDAPKAAPARARKTASGRR